MEVVVCFSQSVCQALKIQIQLVVNSPTLTNNLELWHYIFIEVFYLRSNCSLICGFMSVVNEPPSELEEKEVVEAKD